VASFLEVIDRTRALLEARGRISLAALRREFALDEASVEDVAEELVSAQQVAVREGTVLVWSGDPAASPEATGRAGQAEPQTVSMPLPEHDLGERRQLTVMFCDLVGSTELAQQIDPEELREVLRGYRMTCVEASKRFGGHVAQFLGDGVLIYFGYPQAHEDAASRGVRAGLEIQRALAARRETKRIEARVGIHTGLVVVDPSGAGDDALALGPTTNLAARIERFAEPGKVVISDATLRLCRSRFVTEPLGEVALKGIQGPVRLHRVESTAGVRSGFEITSSTPMVGRDREIGWLLDRWEEVLEGRGHVSCVTGEAGMGKSRLIQALHDELVGTPHLWLDMQCSPFTSGTAFQPLVDLQTAGLSLDEADSPAEASRLLVDGIEGVAGLRHEAVIPYMLDLLSLPPSERYPLLQTSANEQRERTFAALLQLMLKLAEAQPAVLVAEDLHWSDPSTLEFLERLVDQAATAPLMLVITARPEFEVRWTQSHVSVIKLSRLSRQATREMIANAARRNLPEPVLAELETRSDGVPLFAGELTANVVGSGVMIETAGRYEFRGSLRDLSIPATLQDSLMARLDRLSASKQTAQQAATLGREFSYELIEAVTDLDTSSLRNALAQLVASEILHQRGAPPEATYTFRHALLQDTAYESLLYSTRRMLHARIAEALQERFPARVESEPELMARHCAAAGLPDDAVTYYQRAAELAVKRLSNRECAEHHASALEALASLPEDDARHQREISIRLAQAQALMAITSYDAPKVVENIARVEELAAVIGEGPQQLPALIGLVQFDVARGDNLNSRGRAEKILGIAEPLAVKELISAAHLIIGGTDLLIGSAISAKNHLERAVSIGESANFPPPATPNDIDSLGIAQTTYALALVSCGAPGKAIESLRSARERVARFGNDNSIVQVASMTALAGFVLHEPEMARSAADETLLLAEGRGFHTAQLMAMVYRGWARATLGEIEDGVRDVDRGLEIADSTGSAAGVALLCVAAAEAHCTARDRKRAEALLDRADRIIEERGETYSQWVLGARAQLELELGEGDAACAESLLLEACAVARGSDILWDELTIGTRLARLAPRTGRVREAHAHLADVYGRLEDGFDRPMPLAARAALDELATAL